MIYTILGTFISFLKLEGAGIRLQIGPRKILDFKQFDQEQDWHNVGPDLIPNCLIVENAS